MLVTDPFPYVESEMRNAYQLALSFGSDYGGWWQSCPEGHALIQWASWIGVNKYLLVSAACNCVDTVIDLVPVEYHDQIYEALITFKNCARGDVSQERIRSVYESLDRLKQLPSINQPGKVVIQAVAMASGGSEVAIRFMADASAIAQTPGYAELDYEPDYYGKAFNQANKTCADAIQSTISLDFIGEQWNAR